MVHSVEAAVLLVVFEQRKFGDPEQLVLVRVDEPEPFRDLAAERAERVEHDFVLVGDNEHDVARLDAESCLNSRVLVVGQEFRVGRRHLAAVILEPSESLCLIGLDEIGERIDFLARELVDRALDVDSAHRAAGGDCSGEHLELGMCKQVGKVAELEAEAQVGLVRAEALHSLAPGHAYERRGQVDTLELVEQADKELFVYLHDVVFGDVGHLEVDLREFGLTVSAEVLVSEAARDLEVAVEAGQHQKLLIELRRLRQSVELARVYAARHEVVARALGRRLYKAGRLDIDKAVLVVKVARDFDDAAAV